MYDIIIIGNGPAGISAALYTTRAGFSTLIVGKDIGALQKTDKIENYYGFSEPISGEFLVENGIQQAIRLGAAYQKAEVTAITQEDGFKVTCGDESFYGKCVLLATGKSRKKPAISGLTQLEGKGVSYCAVCDAFFYRGKKTAVIGAGAYALSEARELLRVTKDVTIFTNGQPQLEDMKDFTVKTEKIAEITGEEKVDGILLEDGTKIDTDGVFLAVGSADAGALATKIGILTKNNSIVVDENFETNCKGIFAAGDCIGGFLQIAKAVSDGALAAQGISRRLKKL